MKTTIYRNVFMLLISLIFSANLFAQKTAKEFQEEGTKKYHKKDYKSAIEYFSKAIEKDSMLKDSYIYRAIAKDAMDNFAGAIVDFNKAKQIDTTDVFLYVERAKTFINMEELEAAEKDFLTVVKLNPNSMDAADAFYYLARIKYKQKLYEPAANYYTRILRFKPTDPDIFYGRGECKFLLNDYHGSIKDFDRAIEYDPEHEKAYAKRGEAKLKLDDKPGACADFKKARSNGERSVEAMMKEACK